MSVIAQTQSFVEKVLNQAGSTVTRGESQLVIKIVQGISEKKLLFLNPKAAKQVMAKVQAFFLHVLFPHYRLWDGMAIVLKEASYR